MQYCKLLATHVGSNLQLNQQEHDDLIDPSLYMQLIRSLIYPMNTRLYIFYAMNTLNQFMVYPQETHCVVVKHALRYSTNTINYGISFIGVDGLLLHGFFNLRQVRGVDSQKSTYRFSFILESWLTYWLSRNHVEVSFTLVEVEYIETFLVSCEVEWLLKLVFELVEMELDPTVMYCDNQICIKIFKNHSFHNLSKHNNIRYHFQRDTVELGVLPLDYIPTYL